MSRHGSTEDGAPRFEDVKERLEERGESEELASEIAARDVGAARHATADPGADEAATASGIGPSMVEH